MTHKELSALIGKQGYIAVSGLRVNVEVFDVKQAYGNIRYLVRPVSGSGESWINADSLLDDKVTAA